MFEARPQAIEAAAKIPTPTRKIDRRPNNVAEGTADENQSSQEQSIRFDHPLNADDGCVQVCLERRQSYIDDSAVDEGHAGTKNCRCEDPTSRLRSARNVSIHRPDHGFVAWRFHRG